MTLCGRNCTTSCSVSDPAGSCYDSGYSCDSDTWLSLSSFSHTLSFHQVPNTTIFLSVPEVPEMWKQDTRTAQLVISQTSRKYRHGHCHLKHNKTIHIRISYVPYSALRQALWRNQQMHLWLCTLFIDHTYMFRSPSATILRVYWIKEYNKNMCVWGGANLSKIWIHKIL
jgi:hypothetical protein